MNTVQSNCLFYQPEDSVQCNGRSYQETTIQDVLVTKFSPTDQTLQKVLDVVGHRFIANLSQWTLWEVFSSPQQIILADRKLEQLKDLSEGGDSAAQYLLQVCDFIHKSVDQRINILRDAASRGNSIAQFVFGYYHARGLGVVRNPGTAARWCQKAAENSLCEAQFNYGLCLSKGKGIQRDPETATTWFEKAARQNHPKAQDYLTEAQFSTGLNYYEQGLAKEAFPWFKKAAMRGHRDAQYYLSRCYLGGIGVQLNKIKGAKWCERAALQKHPIALILIGTCYYNGEGVLPNREKGISYLEEAAMLGQTKACELLRIIRGNQSESLG